MPPQSNPASLPPIEETLRTELPFFLLLSALFLGYGGLVRRGILREKQVLWAGIILGIITVSLSTLRFWRPGQPMVVQLINPIILAVCTGLCISMAQKNQRVEDIFTQKKGETSLVVRVGPLSQLSQLSQLDALLLPTSTELRSFGGPSAQIAMLAGRAYENEVNRLAPVEIGKTIVTGTYNLFPISVEAAGSKNSKIYHIATHEARKNMKAENLKRGIDSALQKAAKAQAKTVAIACGKFPGLTLEESTNAIVGAVGRHQNKFTNIYFCALDTITAVPLKSALETILGESDAKVLGDTDAKVLGESDAKV